MYFLLRIRIPLNSVWTQFIIRFHGWITHTIHTSKHIVYIVLSFIAFGLLMVGCSLLATCNNVMFSSMDGNACCQAELECQCRPICLPFIYDLTRFCVWYHGYKWLADGWFWFMRLRIVCQSITHISVHYTHAITYSCYIYAYTHVQPHTQTHCWFFSPLLHAVPTCTTSDGCNFCCTSWTHFRIVATPSSSGYTI